MRTCCNVCFCLLQESNIMTLFLLFLYCFRTLFLILNQLARNQQIFVLFGVDITIGKRASVHVLRTVCLLQGEHLGVVLALYQIMGWRFCLYDTYPLPSPLYNYLHLLQHLTYSLAWFYMSLQHRKQKFTMDIQPDNETQ